MPINFTCPHCQHQVLVADEFAGQTGPCARCQQTITIPGTSPFSPTENLSGQGTTENPYARPMQATTPYPVPPKTQAPSDLGMRILLPVDRSVLAIIAGYMGLFAVLFFPAPIALVLGILAVVDIKRHPKKHGLGRAWFAIAMGGVFTILLAMVMLGGLFIP